MIKKCMVNHTSPGVFTVYDVVEKLFILLAAFHRIGYIAMLIAEMISN